jgi:hypothetical protein
MITELPVISRSSETGEEITRVSPSLISNPDTGNIQAPVLRRTRISSERALYNRIIIEYR